MNDSLRLPSRWTLADLVDFEARLAVAAPVTADERLRFARDVRPRLAGVTPLTERRRGLRAWLADRREDEAAPGPGELWRRGVGLLRLTLFVAMAVSGAGLAVGLCLGPQQAVHVVLFLAAGLLVPWSLFVLLRLVTLVARGSRPLLRRGVTLILRLAERAFGARDTQPVRDWAERLTDTVAARRAVAAEIGGLLQWGGFGFQVGLCLAFVAMLTVFDVRFYWEATPQSDALVRSATEAVAFPWAWAWPAAVPDAATVEASRAHYVDGVKQLPPASSSPRWWRFLLMTLLVWGVLPRLLLISVYRVRVWRALAALDFQAPRHRALWRGLTAVERGAVGAGAADAALVLDVGGIGITGEAVRGFLLRRLRLNPTATCCVSVLDEAAEAAADAALAARPPHVVLLVADWALSPRQAAALQVRVRRLAGAATPLSWVVLAIRDGEADAPANDAFSRWTAFVDSLRDPAAEAVAYAPAG